MQTCTFPLCQLNTIPQWEIIAFFLQIAIIYYTTRFVINALFGVFMRFTKSEFASSWLLALVYLPGTFVHEMAHFATAIVLLLPVRDISLLPTVRRVEKGYYIKLGHVVFGHKDYLRTSLVGIAPLFAGLMVLFFVFHYDIFPTQNILLNIFGAYLMFSITSSMFSSEKDMEGTLILIPVMLLFLSLAIGFDLNIFELLQRPAIKSFLQNMNLYLLYGSVTNVVLYLIVKKLLRR